MLPSYEVKTNHHQGYILRILPVGTKHLIALYSRSGLERVTTRPDLIIQVSKKEEKDWSTVPVRTDDGMWTITITSTTKYTITGLMVVQHIDKDGRVFSKDVLFNVDDKDYHQIYWEDGAGWRPGVPHT